MLGGADNANGELLSYITGADTCSLYTQSLALKHTYEVYFGYDRTLRKYGRFRQKLPVMSWHTKFGHLMKGDILTTTQNR